MHVDLRGALVHVDLRGALVHVDLRHLINSFYIVCVCGPLCMCIDLISLIRRSLAQTTVYIWHVLALNAIGCG